MPRPVAVKIKKLHPDAKTPKYMTDLASGADCFANLDTFDEKMEIGTDDKGRFIWVQPMERILVPLGFSMEFDFGYEIQLRPRSGLSYRRGLSLANCIGSIDCDYRGQFMASIINLDVRAQKIHHGERICQMVLAPVFQMSFEEVDELSDTARSGGGFGHTGTSTGK